MNVSSQNFGGIVRDLGLLSFKKQMDDILQLINSSEEFDKNHMIDLYYTMRQVRDSAENAMNNNNLEEKKVYLNEN